MLGTFTYDNPCAIHFGPEALDNLEGELKKYGPVVLLTYGGGSIKRTGLYDQIMKILDAADKTVVEVPGVMSNPTVAKMHEGAKTARDNDVDLILAVGGGSTIDYAKAISVAAWCTDEDPWKKYWIDGQPVDNKIIPVGDVLTMSGTGSEVNGGSVLSDHENDLKIGRVFGSDVIPKFAIVNPELTYTVPDYQMRAGIFDAFNHLQEQYFAGEDDNTSDYIAEGLMRSLVHASRIAVKDPKDYEARSNISWVSTWALNTLVGSGTKTDWEVHMLGQAMGAVTDATHGMTLSAVAMPYYKLIMPYAVEKFARFAVNVWGVNPAGKTDKQVAEEGLQAFSDWMDDLGVVRHSRDLGFSEDKIDEAMKATFILDGGYHKLTQQEVRKIFEESL